MNIHLIYNISYVSCINVFIDFVTVSDPSAGSPSSSCQKNLSVEGRAINSSDVGPSPSPPLSSEVHF